VFKALHYATADGITWSWKCVLTTADRAEAEKTFRRLVVAEPTSPAKALASVAGGRVEVLSVGYPARSGRSITVAALGQDDEFLAAVKGLQPASV
jgi:hypothetical protein